MSLWLLSEHDKKADDIKFVKFLHIIKSYSTDDINFVKKSVNWASRQIGKRNINLNEMAIETAKEILKSNSKIVRWVASNALVSCKVIA